MQFFTIVIQVALVVLTAWWIRRLWDRDLTLSERLDSAAAKVAVGLFAAFFIPAFLLATFGPLSKDTSNLILMGVWVFVAVAFLLIVTARVVKTGEEIRARSALRLSGHPVPPKLLPAWGVATITGIVLLFLFFTAFITYFFLVTYIATLEGQNIPNDSFQAVIESLVIGACIVWVVIVALMWAIQKASNFTDDREYAQLKTGIENRLAAQRAELMASMNNEPTDEKD